MSFEEVYRKYEKLTNELAAENEPLELAGAMMGQAVKLYKIILTPEDFDALMHIISQARGLEEAGLTWDEDNNPGGTLH